jgi:hypothetical protein
MPKRTTPGVDSFSRLMERWQREQRTMSKLLKEPGVDPVEVCAPISFPVPEGGRGTWTEEELMVVCTGGGGRRELCQPKRGDGDGTMEDYIEY